MGITEIFGSNVFSLAVMKERLPKSVYKEVRNVMENGGSLSAASADTVAEAMKNWAVEKGATHYTHWFQPLTVGATAEKHDSFLTVPDEMGKTILQLSGKKLIMGEPDASSFPSGGLRGTSYARGYTAWDITSPAFVKEQSCGNILCIPTVFVSYTGEALDAKTPLLRSMEAVSKEAVALLKLFGKDIKRVAPSVGPEQEYFLVDRQKYLKRRDLIYTGRTLFGAPAPKGQELDDHYFGSIRERVGAYMADLNVALWKYGITATTQHNEVAPAQHEMAPIFSTANVAVDQNNLAMETMKRIATKHDLVCLLHEKPYAGVNGSGKHNNWSLGTSDGENLFDPGDKPEENLQFQLILACVMAAVDDHADLLRESASDVGNDHRLGAQEAPPAIISIFLGDQLEALVNQIIAGDELNTDDGGKLDTGVSTVPVLKKDATDRNRTSPFAFTGNRFEFRMVGSRDNIAGANTALNAIMAEAFANAVEALKDAEDFEAACKEYIKKLMAQHQRIVFNGDGYSEEWVAEAARRGLPNIKCMVDAISVLTKEDVIKLYTQFGIFTKEELEARADIMYESYAKQIGIEAKTMIHLAGKRYLPAIIDYTTEVAQSITSVEAAGVDATVQRQLLNEVTVCLKKAATALNSLKAIFAEVDAIEDVEQLAKGYRYKVVPAMDTLRAAVDAAELLVNKKAWPCPTYGDLMFEV